MCRHIYNWNIVTCDVKQQSHSHWFAERFFDFLKLDSKHEVNDLYQVCVLWAGRETKMAALASDWLWHILLLWNRLTEFNKTVQYARSQCPLPSLGSLGRSENQDGHPCLWLAETSSTSLKLLNGIHWNLTGSKILISSTMFVFWADLKTKMAALASDWLRHYRLHWYCLSEFNKTWQEQDLNILCQVCVFRIDGKLRWPPWFPID